MERRLVFKDGTKRTSLNVPSPIGIEPFWQTFMYVLLPINIGGELQGSIEENISIEHAMWCDGPESRTHLPWSRCMEAMSAFPLSLNNDVDVVASWY